jgi:hypothetical protein
MHPAASNVTQSPIGMSSIVAIAVRPISAWTLLRIAPFASRYTETANIPTTTGPIP